MNTELPTNKLLRTALVEAQKVAKSVSKDGLNSFHKYKYATAEDMIEEGRSALNTVGLALVTKKFQVVPYVLGELASTKVAVTYELWHTSGESELIESETSVVPEKGRPQDKGEACALTYNIGYTIRGLLCLPRVDADTDVDQRDDRTNGGPPLASGTPAAPPPAVTAILNAIKATKSKSELAAVSMQIKNAGLTTSPAVRTAYAAQDSVVK